MRALPNSVIGLIEELEEQYPQRCTNPDQSREESLFSAGKAMLVEELRLRYEAEIKSNKKRLPKVLR